MLLAAAFMAPARVCLAQALSVQPAIASSGKTPSAASTTTARKSNARAKKAAPVAEVPQTPPPPPTLEQQSPAPPQVSYQDGQLTIESQNATLSQVLHSVQTQTGAWVEIPPGTGSERVVAKLGPGNPKDVLASLLNGSKFNYIILGETNNSERVQKIILMTKSATTGGAPVTTAQNNFQPPAPMQMVEPTDDDPPQNEPEPEVLPQPGQPGVPGGEQVAPDAPGIQENPLQPGGRTPEQMLQELQRMQQQQLQYQQQLNPSNQQQVPFPNQPQ